jgi:hypothetical protein
MHQIIDTLLTFNILLLGGVTGISRLTRDPLWAHTILLSASAIVLLAASFIS